MSDVIEQTRHDYPDITIFRCAQLGDENTLLKLLDRGQDINAKEIRTGMTAIHYAVAHKNFDFLQLLTILNAQYTVDGFGRYPSTIAAICECSREICDFIALAEGNFLPAYGLQTPSLVLLWGLKEEVAKISNARALGDVTEEIYYSTNFLTSVDRLRRQSNAPDTLLNWHIERNNNVTSLGRLMLEYSERIGQLRG